MSRLRHNYQHLVEYCEQNKIILTEDYKNYKITRDSYIRGECQSENCKNSFIKYLDNLKKLEDTVLIVQINALQKKLKEQVQKNLEKKMHFKMKILN